MLIITNRQRVAGSTDGKAFSSKFTIDSSILSVAKAERLMRDHIDVLEAHIADLEQTILRLEDRGIRLVTVLDEQYPLNLRLVYDRPPFLFIRGSLLDEDARSIAVVGTRKASADGLQQAERLAHGLVDRGVTVVSGLALGIDGAAHRAALAGGGRTVAVIGNGIASRIYPREHAALAEEIVMAGGAVVSQFLPDAPSRQENFRLRNRTMSGLALGTTVVEASTTSGARMQARIALEHGKRVFLLRDLVLREEWAKRYAEHPGASVVDDAAEVLRVLDALPQAVGAQLTLV